MVKKLTVSASLLGDPRFLKLCVRLGDEEKAIGKVVLAYKLAAEFWWPNRQAIPAAAWSAASLGSELLEVGLANTVDAGPGCGVSVLVEGLEEQFAWRFHVAGAGAKGGKSKHSSSRAKAKLSCAKAELSSAKAVLEENSASSSQSDA